MIPSRQNSLKNWSSSWRLWVTVWRRQPPQQISVQLNKVYNAAWNDSEKASSVVFLLTYTLVGGKTQIYNAKNKLG